MQRALYLSRYLRAATSPITTHSLFHHNPCYGGVSHLTQCMQLSFNNSNPGLVIGSRFAATKASPIAKNKKTLKISTPASASRTRTTSSTKATTMKAKTKKAKTKTIAANAKAKENAKAKANALKIRKTQAKAKAVATANAKATKKKAKAMLAKQKAVVAKANQNARKANARVKLRAKAMLAKEKAIVAKANQNARKANARAKLSALKQQRKEREMARKQKQREKLAATKQKQTETRLLRKYRDPHRPKRPLAAYLRFCSAYRLENASTLPTMSPTTIKGLAQGFSEEWKALSDQRRQEFVKAHATERESYTAAKETYVKQNKRQVWLDFLGTHLQQRPPSSGYQGFVRETLYNKKGKGFEFAAQQWNALTDAQKLQYQTKYGNLYTQWKAKMPRK